MTKKTEEPRRETDAVPLTLDARLKLVRDQKEQARNLYHQAVGAEQAILALISDRDDKASQA